MCSGALVCFNLSLFITGPTRCRCYSSIIVLSVSVSIYRPPKHEISQFITDLSKILDFYKPMYERVVIVGDFNSEPRDREIIEFINNHILHNHMHQKTCWKSPKGTRRLDLVLSNHKHSLQNTGTLETGLSDHYFV